MFCDENTTACPSLDPETRAMHDMLDAEDACEQADLDAIEALDALHAEDNDSSLLRTARSVFGRDTRPERLSIIRSRAPLFQSPRTGSGPILRSRASLGFVESPCCFDPGPHDDNGCTGSQRAFCCASCGLHFDAENR